MTPRLVLIVREDGSLQATCDCGGVDEIVPVNLVPGFLLHKVTRHVKDHSDAERCGRGQ